MNQEPSFAPQNGPDDGLPKKLEKEESLETDGNSLITREQLASDQTDPNAEEPISEEASAAESEEAVEKPSFARSAFEFLEMFAFSVFAVLIVFTFFLRLCRVEGASMENTLYGDQALLLSSVAYTPEQGDIIVFHLTNHDDNMEKTMVKRVIATGGQELVIDFNTGIITVDGVEYDDPHRTLKDLTGRTVDYYSLYATHYYDRHTKILKATIPEGTVFVMGDNRNNSKDSRNSDVGFVDERCILGKVVLRLSPFTVLT